MLVLECAFAVKDHGYVGQGMGPRAHNRDMQILKTRNLTIACQIQDP